jgi:hypothetical protein
VRGEAVAIDQERRGRQLAPGVTPDRKEIRSAFLMGGPDEGRPPPRMQNDCWYYFSAATPARDT